MGKESIRHATTTTTTTTANASSRTPSHWLSIHPSNKRDQVNRFTSHLAEPISVRPWPGNGHPFSPVPWLTFSIQYDQPVAVAHYPNDQRDYATYDQSSTTPDVFPYFQPSVNTHLLPTETPYTQPHQFQSHSPADQISYTPSPDWSLKPPTGNQSSASPASWTEDSGGRPAQVHAAKRGRSTAKVNATAGRSRKRLRKIDVQPDSGESESDDEGSEVLASSQHPKGTTVPTRL